jgi:hypothetical protein
MRGQVFKQGCTVAAESPKVPLEIFFNPAILSDNDLFSEFPDFFAPLNQKGCFLLPLQREEGRDFRIGVVDGLD